MNYIDKDIKDHEDYIEFTTFNKFNIKIFFIRYIFCGQSFIYLV